MSSSKKIGKILLILILVPIGLIIIAVMAMLGVHLFSQDSIDHYVPDGFILSLQSPSVLELYEEISESEVLNIALNNDQYGGIYQSILDFKASDFSQSFLFKELLNLEARFLLYEDNVPAIIIDPGIKGAFTRHIPFALNFISLNNITLGELKKGDQTMYMVQMESGMEIYCAFVKDLILVALDRQQLESMLSVERGAGGPDLPEKISNSFIHRKHRGPVLSLHAALEPLILPMVKDSTLISNIVNQLNLEQYGRVDLGMVDQDFALEAGTGIQPDDELLKQFFSIEPMDYEVLDIIPDNTNLMSAIHFESLELLIDIYNNYSPQEEQIDTAFYNKLLSDLLGVGLNELLYTWTGQEAGMFTMNSAPEPTFFVKISDSEKLNSVLATLDKSLLLVEDTSLEIENVTITQVRLPELASFFVKSAVGNIQFPYLVVKDDFLFISFNPENLAMVVNKSDNQQLMAMEPGFKRITENVPHQGHILLYYDLAVGIPRFLEGDELLSRVLRYYNQGLVSMNYSQDEINCHVFSYKAEPVKATLFHGFPRTLSGQPGKQLLASDLGGSTLMELAFILDQSRVVISDLTGNTIDSYPIRDGYLFTENSGTPGVYAFTDNQYIYKFNRQGDILPPFPKVKDYAGSFPPVHNSTEILYYSLARKALVLLNKSTGAERILDFELTRDVLYPPVITDHHLIFYPKSLYGTVEKTDLNGNPVPGWPVSGGGISITGPVEHRRGNEHLIMYLAQKGTLSVWDENGSAVFVKDLSGVFHAAPITVNLGNGESGIAVLSDESTLFILDNSGKIRAKETVSCGKAEAAVLLARDIDNNGVDELFIHGSAHLVFGFDLELDVLPGFPLIGSSEPVFADLDTDGNTEMLVTSPIGRLYAYTVKAKRGDQ